MDKNLTVVLSVVGLIALAGVGFMVWNSQQPSPITINTVTDNINPNNSDNTNTNTGAQAKVPDVQTDTNTAPYISTVVVKGTVNPNGALTTYWYEYGKTADLGVKTKEYLAGSGFAKVYAPAYITGLQSNTDYYYRLAASNSLGTVNGSTYTFKTNTTPAPTAVAPIVATTSATNIDKTVASLRGQINPKGSETTFWFEYGTSTGLGAVTAFQSAGDTNSSVPVSVALSNLQPFTKYYFRLNAQNQFGTVNGEILNFTTKGPAEASAPTVKTTQVSAITNSSAKLNGTVNPNGAQTTYWFEYSDNSLLANVIVSTTPQQSLDGGTSSMNVSANISGLKKDTKYYVKAVAKNQYGTVRGDTETFTTKK